jgi:hypothetical protein
MTERDQTKQETLSPIINMHDGSALIHPVRPSATGWTVGVVIGSGEW